MSHLYISNRGRPDWLYLIPVDSGGVVVRLGSCVLVEGVFVVKGDKPVCLLFDVDDRRNLKGYHDNQLQRQRHYGDGAKQGVLGGCPRKLTCGISQGFDIKYFVVNVLDDNH